MSSYADLSINGKIIRTYRNGISDELLAVFNTNGIYDFQGEKGVNLAKKLGFDDYAEMCEDDDDVHLVVLCQKAGVLKRRLSIYGFGQKTFLNQLRSSINEEIERKRSLLEQYPNQSLEEKIKQLNEISHSMRNTNTSNLVLNKDYLSCVENYLDDCNLLYGYICNCRDDQDVFLNISDIVEGGWIETDDFDEGSYSMPNPLIITEGVNDLYVLKKSLSILHPELVDNINFLDTSFKPEGGAGPIVKMIKSFASAHISNRILAILDNDSAASEALLGLKKFSLPKNIHIIQYPPIKLLEEYPTIGPQGESIMDVNGLAGSIEMYLGRTALCDEHGDLEKIQWKGFISSVKRYQGVLINKEKVNQNFRSLIKQYSKNDCVRESLKLDDLKYVWDCIIDELETIEWVQEPLVGAWA